MQLYIFKMKSEVKMEDWKWAFLSHYLKTEKMTLLDFVAQVEKAAWHIRHKYEAGMLFRVEVNRTIKRYRDRARNVANQHDSRVPGSPANNSIHEKLAQRVRKGIRANWVWHSDYMTRQYTRKIWPAINGVRINAVTTWQEADKTLRAKDKTYMTDGVNLWD